MIAKLEALKRLLLEEWDPIGVAEAEGARDEYDNYAFNLFVMLSRGAAVEEIATYLDWVESEYMSLPLNADRNRAVAERARAIFSENEAP
jgi:hypothetical protein